LEQQKPQPLDETAEVIADGGHSVDRINADRIPHRPLQVNPPESIREEHALAVGATAVRPHHLGVGRSLINEHQPSRVRRGAGISTNVPTRMPVALGDMRQAEAFLERFDRP